MAEQNNNGTRREQDVQGFTYVTRSGNMPSRNDLNFPVSTSEVTDYVQDNLNVAIARLDTNRAVKQIFKNPNIKVNSSNVSQKFKPFIAILPLEFDVKSSIEQRAPRISNDLPEAAKRAVQMSQGSNQHKRGIKLYMQIEQVLKRYMYAYEDARGLFNNPQFRRERLISERDARQLMSIVKPRTQVITNERGQKEKVIIVLLDPLAVFHDMLEIKGFQREFNVSITKMTRLDSATNYLYDVRRIVLPKKKNKNKGKYENFDIFGNSVKNS